MNTAQANAEQIEYWNTTAGVKWTEMHGQIDAQLAAHGGTALEVLSPRTGERGLDIGCGCGSTTVELARRVGPEGFVIGLDISSVMLERARFLADVAAVTNVRFECADAQVCALEPSSFDFAYSRFGVMFFDDPTTAFRNIHRALKPEGRLAFICWNSAAENPWMSLPMLAAMPFVKIEVAADPYAPGPFAFADAERVCSMLRTAGFAQTKATELRTDMAIAGGVELDGALEFMLRISPISRALAEVETTTRDAAIAAVRKAMAAYARGGSVHMPSSAWVITAAASEEIR
jgi:ubiquinone/menaquinone biosynthesis C-methylase UbiE